MLHSNGKKHIFFGWFHLTIIRIGDVLDVVGAVSSDGENIGRVTYLVCLRDHVMFHRLPLVPYLALYI